MNGIRESGVLLHLTSLPGPFGIGDIGPPARQLAEMLARSGQTLWQVLPLGPTGFGDSPYQALSSYAGNPLLISPEDLLEDGLLSADDLRAYPTLAADAVDYGRVIRAKSQLIARACRRLTGSPLTDQFDAFRDTCGDRWLHDYALYAALKRAHDGRPWTQWETSLISRDPVSLKRAARRLSAEVVTIEMEQFLFSRQWRRFRSHCAGCGVRLIGDLPIYVAHDSADAWVAQDQLQLDGDGMPPVVAGVPPDYFSSAGQRWGNPLYRWDTMVADGFRWWKERIGHVLELTDYLRIDHFRGFEAYWEIPADQPTAAGGHWVQAPGFALLETLREAIEPLPLIAEDLGVITPEVEALRRHFGLPGMKVLQFRFNGDPGAPDFGTRGFPTDCVCYTGTHDNDTLLGWLYGSPAGQDTRSEEQVGEERARVLAYLGESHRPPHWALIELAMESMADTAIVPLQDILGLGSEARMNVPSRALGNWRWRAVGAAEMAEGLGRMCELATQSGRTGPAA